MTDQELEQQKDIQFYNAVITAWINTALEHDKSVLALSAGGLGLVATLISTVGVANVVLLVLYIAAMLAFLLAVICVLWAFRKSRKHLEQVLKKNDAPDPVLDVLDGVALASFGVGAMLLAIIGMSTAALSYAAKEPQMGNERITRDGLTDLGKSLNNIGSLRPGSGGSAPAHGSTPAQGSTPAPAPAPAQQPSSPSK